jgi:hypothetical protein
MDAKTPSLADRARSAYQVRWSPQQRVLFESIAAAVCAYFLSASFEAAVIRSIGPTEWELAWVSDVVLAGAFGTAVYLWAASGDDRRELEEGSGRSSSSTRSSRLPPTFSVSCFLRCRRMSTDSSGRRVEIRGNDWWRFLRLHGRSVRRSWWCSSPMYQARESRQPWRSARCDRRFARSHVKARIPARIVTQTLGGTLRRLARRALCDVRRRHILTCGQRTITTTNAGHPPAIVKGSRRIALPAPRRSARRDSSATPRSSRSPWQLHTGDACFIVTDGVNRGT